MFPDIDEMELSDAPNIDSILRVIGEDALACLSADFGGSQFSIPLKPGEHSPLAASIGLEAAQRLAYVWGGMCMSVPLRAGRKERIRRMLEQNVPINKIARELGVSRWLIYEVEAAASSNQPDLFSG